MASQRESFAADGSRVHQSSSGIVWKYLHTERLELLDVSVNAHCRYSHAKKSFLLEVVDVFRGLHRKLLVTHGLEGTVDLPSVQLSLPGVELVVQRARTGNPDEVPAEDHKEDVLG